MTSSDTAIDFSKLTPVELIFGDDFEETQQRAALFEEAELYLNSFAWCRGVKKVYFGLGVSDFIGVFLFEVVPSEDEQERYHWVVAGDVPPARLSMTDYPNLAVALKGYIQEMRERCSTALASGKGNAAHEHELMRRMQLVDREILSLYREELSQDGFDEGIVTTKQHPLPSIPSEGPTLPRSSVAASRTIASPRPAPGTSCSFPR